MPVEEMTQNQSGECREKSHVTVTRNDPKDVKQRQMIVKLDDEPFATLMYGETVTRAVKPGRHRLRVDNTWVWKTVEFTLAPGEDAKFRVINRTGMFTWWLVAALGAGPMYVTIERGE
jgi:hypothetical protein